MQQLLGSALAISPGTTEISCFENSATYTSAAFQCSDTAGLDPGRLYESYLELSRALRNSPKQNDLQTFETAWCTAAC